MLLHLDSAPAPKKSVVEMAAVHDCGFTFLDHSPYSLHLALPDFSRGGWVVRWYWVNAINMAGAGGAFFLSSIIYLFFLVSSGKGPINPKQPTRLLSISEYEKVPS